MVGNRVGPTPLTSWLHSVITLREVLRQRFQTTTSKIIHYTVFQRPFCVTQTRTHTLTCRNNVNGSYLYSNTPKNAQVMSRWHTMPSLRCICYHLYTHTSSPTRAFSIVPPVSRRHDINVILGELRRLIHARVRTRRADTAHVSVQPSSHLAMVMVVMVMMVSAGSATLLMLLLARAGVLEPDLRDPLAESGDLSDPFQVLTVRITVQLEVGLKYL